MLTPTIVSIIANIVLGIALISHMFGPKVYKYITEQKKLRETQRDKGRKEEIRRIVREYLEELKKDG